MSFLIFDHLLDCGTSAIAQIKVKVRLKWRKRTTKKKKLNVEE